MSKTLSEIVNEVKSGNKPDYDDLKYAICALDALLTFEGSALTQLYKSEKENKRKLLSNSAVWQHEESFRRNKAAFNKPPKEWIGWSNDPENPEYLKRRNLSIKLFNKFKKKD